MIFMEKKILSGKYQLLTLDQILVLQAPKAPSKQCISRDPASILDSLQPYIHPSQNSIKERQIKTTSSPKKLLNSIR
jgi:hypothetical protein